MSLRSLLDHQYVDHRYVDHRPVDQRVSDAFAVADARVHERLAALHRLDAPGWSRRMWTTALRRYRRICTAPSTQKAYWTLIATRKSSRP